MQIPLKTKKNVKPRHVKGWVKYDSTGKVVWANHTKGYEKTTPCVIAPIATHKIVKKVDIEWAHAYLERLNGLPNRDEYLGALGMLNRLNLLPRKGKTKKLAQSKTVFK